MFKCLGRLYQHEVEDLVDSLGHKIPNFQFDFFVVSRCYPRAVDALCSVLSQFVIDLSGDFEYKGTILTEVFLCFYGCLIVHLAASNAMH